jgi:hypothetical protein
MATIYEQLEAIAADHPELLRHYRADLTTHDRRVLEDVQAGTKWLWILRRCGTTLFPLHDNVGPLWATYWLDGSPGREKGTLAFHISMGHGGHGTVTPISHDQAKAYAREGYTGTRRATA